MRCSPSGLYSGGSAWPYWPVVRHGVLQGGSYTARPPLAQAWRGAGVAQQGRLA